MTTRPLGLRGPDPHHRRLALSASPHRMPDDYQPAERSHPNTQYLRHWRDQPGPSCVGHGVAQCYEIGKVRHGQSALDAVARLHLHTLGLLAQTPFGQRIQVDGTYTHLVLNALCHVGVGLERDWPPLDSNVAVRPPLEVELNGLERASGHFWQLHYEPGERLWREVCWTIDTFGAAIIGKQVNSRYMSHSGEGVLPAPGPNDEEAGGHCTVLTEYRNFGAELLEDNSWRNWGFRRAVIGSDGNTRQVDSLAWVSRDWLWSRFHMNAYCWVPWV
jgi:hypothetical protein